MSNEVEIDEVVRSGFDLESAGSVLPGPSYSYDSEDKFGNPLPMAGTYRPSWEEVSRWPGYIFCACGQTLQTVQGVHEHWQLGHFDRQLYGPLARADMKPQKR